MEAIVTGEGDGPVVVLLHGFGAPGDDLVALGPALGAPEGTRFVFPAAPLDLGGGRAWWMIDVERLLTGEPLDRSGEVAGGSGSVCPPAPWPEGLAPAREAVVALLDEVERRLKPPRMVLGGFSQGAMLSLDVALRGERPLAGLVLLSGTMLAAHEWVPLMERRRGLRVFMSHGTRDPLLPFAAAERLRDHLLAAGLQVEWAPFNGGHEIPWPVLERLSVFLRACLV